MTIEEFFKAAKNNGISQVQIAEQTQYSGSFEVINGQVRNFNYDDIIDYNIKAEFQGKTVKLYSNYLSAELINLIITKCEKTDTSYQDEYFSDRASIPQNTPPKIDISEELKKVKDLDALRKKYIKVKQLTMEYSEEYSNTRIVNTNGIDISTDSYLCGFYVSATTEVDGNVTMFKDNILETEKGKIDFESVSEDVIQKLLIMANKQKIETKKYDVLIDNSVASRIVASLGDMLFAQSIRNKVSCLMDKIDSPIFSQKINIIEDATDRNYPGYRLFDDEGTTTSHKDIVKDGKLKTYLYNIKEAKIANRESSGNGYYGQYTKNMYLVPGNKSRDELLKELGDGIYIVDYMVSGGTSINTINGCISLQVFGFVVQNGKLISGIEPAILTTTIFEFLSNVEEIGNDLTFRNTKSASPSLLVKDISIAR